MKNKVAIVTGSSGKLGPVWCDVLENMGNRVIKVDLPEYDFSDGYEIQFKFEALKKQIGITPDIILNNAALDTPPTDKGGDFFQFRDEIEINLKSAIQLCKTFVPDMLAKEESLIINVEVENEKTNYI